MTFLTDRYDKVYVVTYEITGVYNRFLKAYCPVYDERWEATSGPCTLDSYWCYAFGHRRALTDEMVLVTPELCRDHPQLISPDASTRQHVLEFHFPECRVVPPPPPDAPKLSSIPPTTRQLRSADRPAPTLFMLRPTPDKKPLPRAIVYPPKPRLSFSPDDLEASPSVAASAKRPRRGSVVETEDEDPQKPGGEEEKTPVSEPHLHPPFQVHSLDETRLGGAEAGVCFTYLLI